MSKNLIDALLTGGEVRSVIEQFSKCNEEQEFTEDDINAVQELIDNFVSGGYSYDTKYYNIEAEKQPVQDPRYNCNTLKVALWTKGDKYPPHEEFSDVTFKRGVPDSIVDLGDELADFINVKSGHKYDWYDTNHDNNYYYVYFKKIK